jgi:uncharacterized protein YggE
MVIVVLAAALVIMAVTWSVQTPKATAAAVRDHALSATRDSAPPTINVSANAIVKVQPDLAYFEVGVLTQDKSAARAQEMADRVIARTMKALQEKGVARKDLATSVCNLCPSYVHPYDRRTFVGYQGDSFVTVNVRDLSKLGKLIDACMAAGATNISDVEFRVDDIRKYRKQAREMAVHNARERANQIADAIGVKIVGVKSVNETTSDYPGRGWWWQSRREPMMSQAVAYVPSQTVSEEPEIALGTFPITAGVSVAFEIE